MGLGRSESQESPKLESEGSQPNAVSAHDEGIIGDPNADVSQQEALRFIRILAGTAVPVLLLLIGIVYWANVFGNYGDEGFFGGFNDRHGKALALLEKPEAELPEAWLMGASTVYPLLPSAIEERFGLRTYSLANFWARMKVHWSWLGFVLDDLGSKPEMIILALETWTFCPDGKGPFLYPNIRRELLNSPNLVSHLDDYSSSKIALSKALDLLSSQQLRYSVGSLRGDRPRLFWGPANESVEGFKTGSYNSDGSGPYGVDDSDHFFATDEINEFYREILRGERDPRSAESKAQRDHMLRQSKQIRTVENVESYFPGDDFDQSEIELFERFVARCEEEGIPLAILLMPIHPYYEDELEAKTDHQRHRATLRALVERVAKDRKNHVVVFDATSLASYGGDPGRFHDGNHVMPSEGNKILDRLRERWGAL